MEIIYFRINWFAESLTVRPSKQKSSNNNQKQVKIKISKQLEILFMSTEVTHYLIFPIFNEF